MRVKLLVESNGKIRNMTKKDFGVYGPFGIEIGSAGVDTELPDGSPAQACEFGDEIAVTITGDMDWADTGSEGGYVVTIYGEDGDAWYDTFDRANDAKRAFKSAVSQIKGGKSPEQAAKSLKFDFM